MGFTVVILAGRESNIQIDRRTMSDDNVNGREVMLMIWVVVQHAAVPISTTGDRGKEEGDGRGRPRSMFMVSFCWNAIKRIKKGDVKVNSASHQSLRLDFPSQVVFLGCEYHS